MKPIKIIVEKHPDGYVAYPLGVKGVVVGEGDTFEAALADVTSAIRFHVESFGDDVLDADPPALKLTDAQRRELDRRINQMDANPNAGAPWEDVKAEYRDPRRSPPPY